MENEFIKNDIQYGNILKSKGHRSCLPLDNNDIFSFIFLRDPVERTVSHWLHIYENRLSDNIQKDKSKLIDYIYQNTEKGIINYQTKFISYSGTEEIISIDESGLSNYVDIDSYNLAKNRLNKIDYIFDTKQQGEKLTKFFLKKLYDHFNFIPTTPIEQLLTQSVGMQNPESSELFSSLSKSEYNEIADIMNYDMDLYNTCNFHYV